MSNSQSQTTATEPQTPPIQQPDNPDSVNAAGGATGTSNPPNGGTVDSTVPPSPQDNGAALPPDQQGPDQLQNPEVATPAGIQKALTPAPPASEYAPSPVPKAPNKLFADIMAGARFLNGSVTKTNVDPATGKVTQTQVQPSTGKLLASLAIHAVQGAIAGSTAHGPNAIAEAANQGMDEGEKISKQQQDQEEQQSKTQQQNYINQYQSTEAAMRQYQLQMTMSRQDEEAFQNQTKLNAPIIADAKLQGGPNAVPVEHATEDMMPNLLKQYPVSDFFPVADGYQAQTVDGKQEWKDVHGNLSTVKTPGARPAWQSTFAIVRRGATVNMVDDQGNAHPWTTSGEANGTLPAGSSTVGTNSRIGAASAATANIRTQTIDLFNSDAKRWNEELARAQGGTTSPDGTKQAPASEVPDPNSTVAWNYDTKDIVQAIAKKEGKVNPDGTPTPAARFHNPTNLKATPKQMQDHSVDFDPETGFRKFKSDEEGLAAAERDLAVKKARSPQMTLKELADTWTNNDKTAAGDYAKFLSGQNQGSTPGQTQGPTLPDATQFAKDNPGFSDALISFEQNMGTSARSNKGVPNIGDAIAGMKSQSQQMLMKKFFGGDNQITRLVNQQSTDQKVTEETALAEGKDAIDQAAYNKRMEWLTIPPGYVPSEHPEVTSMGPDELKAFLNKNGVKTPPAFNTIWRLGHMMVSPADFSNKEWFKDQGIDRQTSIAYAGQFVNPYINPDRPGFDEKNYAAAQKFVTGMASNTPGLGALVQSANASLAHLDLLSGLSSAMDSAMHGGNVQALNTIARAYGTQVGATPAETFDFISNAVSAELAKTLNNGNVPDKETIAGYRSKLGFGDGSTGITNDQVQEIIKHATGLIAPKLSSLDLKSVNTVGYHIKDVTPEGTAILKRYQYDTPWQVNTGTGGNSVEATKPYQQPSIQAMNAATLAKPPQTLPQGASGFKPAMNKKTGKHEGWFAVDGQGKPMGALIPLAPQ